MCSACAKVFVVWWNNRRFSWNILLVMIVSWVNRTETSVQSELSYSPFRLQGGFADSILLSVVIYTWLSFCTTRIFERWLICRLEQLMLQHVAVEISHIAWWGIGQMIWNPDTLGNSQYVGFVCFVVFETFQPSQAVCPLSDSLKLG